MALIKCQEPNTPEPLPAVRRSLPQVVVRILCFFLVLVLMGVVGLLFSLYKFIERELPLLHDWLPFIAIGVVGLLILSGAIYVSVRLIVSSFNLFAGTLNRWHQATKLIVDSEHGVWVWWQRQWHMLHLQVSDAEQERRWERWVDTRRGSGSRRLAEPQSVLAEPPEEPLEFYPFERLRDQNHTAFIGPSGAGKSLLARYAIAAYFQGATVRVYDVDSRPDEWGQLEVVGLGGDFNAISEALQEDIDEFEKRNWTRGKGIEARGEIVRVIEELPDTRATLAEEKNFVLDKWMSKLLRRGRKYDMKVFAVSQQFDVKAWGLDRNGSLRKALTVVYLGRDALGALSLVKDPDYKEQLRAHLMQMERPCLVDEKGHLYPGLIPDLSSFERQEQQRGSQAQSPRGRAPSDSQYRVDGESGGLADETGERWEEPIIVDAYEVISDADWQRDGTIPQDWQGEWTGSQPIGKLPDSVEDFLLECLKTPQLASSVLAQGKQFGYSEKTIRRAKKKLGIGSLRRGELWFWLPPDDDDE